MAKKKEKEYTELQQRFLDIFMEPEYKGDIRKAMRAAGFNDSTSVAYVVNTLHEEMVERAQKVLATYGMKAAFALNEALDNPTALGTKERIKTANSILDRIGVKKQEETSEVKLPQHGIIILPAKGMKIETDDDTGAT